MPLKIVRDFSDPAHARRVVYVPDPADRRGTRPQGSYRRDADGRFQTRHADRRPVRYFVGLDLGQAADYSAVAIVEKTEAGLHVVHLDRARGLPYPDIVRMTAGLMAKPPLSGQALLIVDGTGVGRAVVDLLRRAELQPVAVTIHGGAKVTGSRRSPRVPKGDLINGLLLAFQSGSVQIASALPHAATLARELAEMRRKISVNGNASYGVWREGEHDDLVLALAIAIWQAERRAVLLGPAEPETLPEEWPNWPTP
jgi:hypothetical protein